MNRLTITSVERGTPQDLLKAAELGARLECRRRRSRGQDDGSIRETILTRFRVELDSGSFGMYADESLVAVVQRAVDSVLSEPRRGPIPG
ncbi:hypothetical protein P12x_005733 [Tundrisphaera lichenicola]|uniref:hypothetical protein n=1 Tax=Tundrisphaera lichenicola TaxID=2029860 RepID=UPI003EB75CB9